MKTIVYWEVDSCYDLKVTHVGNFSDEDVAKQIVERGRGYRSMNRRTVTIFDSVEDYEDNTREKIRERALAKLTTEEKIVLGIRD